MTRILLAALASLIFVGCGFVDQDIHLSDEEMRAQMELSGSGSGMLSSSGRGYSSGCGIGIGRSHVHHHAYHFGASHIFANGTSSPHPPDPRAVGGMDEHLYAELDRPEKPEPTVDPVPRHIETWGEYIEWHYESARQRGGVDARTEAAMRSMGGD